MAKLAPIAGKMTNNQIPMTRLGCGLRGFWCIGHWDLAILCKVGSLYSLATCAKFFGSSD